MDEMMIRTSDLQGQTNFYYKGRRVIVPESMRKMPRKKLARTGSRGYGNLLVWEISLICGSGKNQNKCRSLHRVHSEADAHL